MINICVEKQKKVRHSAQNNYDFKGNENGFYLTSKLIQLKEIKMVQIINM